MAVQRRALPLGLDQYLLGVGFGIAGSVRPSVPKGKESTPESFKRLASEIGDIPAEHTITNLCRVLTCLAPLIRRPVSKGRERKGEFFENGLCGGDGEIDPRPRKRGFALGGVKGVWETHKWYVRNADVRGKTS